MTQVNMNQVVNDMNTLSKFLAFRNIKDLTQEALFNQFKIKRVDCVIVLGCSIPSVALLGAEIYKKGLAKNLMIVGGKGHSTKYLVNAILSHDDYKNMQVKNQTEADMLKQLITQFSGIDSSEIIIENQSSNCGSNAKESLNVLIKQNKEIRSVLLLQDPIMQLRTFASFLKEWKGQSTQIISYAPFVPKLTIVNNEYSFLSQSCDALWSMPRFIDLLMGEIPRLQDDRSGYGPEGKGYIVHVDIPKKVKEAYDRLLLVFTGYQIIKKRI